MFFERRIAPQKNLFYAHKLFYPQLDLIHGFINSYLVLLLRTFSLDMYCFHSFKLTPDTKRYWNMHRIQRHTFLRIQFLNLVYTFTKIPLIHLKIITRKPLFIFGLLKYKNTHFLLFLKHRQFIFVHATSICIFNCSITLRLMLKTVRHFRRHFITPAANILLGVHFDIYYIRLRWF